MDAQKYSEDFCPPERVDTLESVPHRNIENDDIFHQKVIHVIWRKWFGAQLEGCLWNSAFTFGFSVFTCRKRVNLSLLPV